MRRTRRAPHRSTSVSAGSGTKSPSAGARCSRPFRSGGMRRQGRLVRHDRLQASFLAGLRCSHRCPAVFQARVTSMRTHRGMLQAPRRPRRQVTRTHCGVTQALWATQGYLGTLLGSSRTRRAEATRGIDCTNRFTCTQSARKSLSALRSFASV